MWGAGACFTLTDYTDSQGGSLRVIKDWRDMVNQVGDNRCLLQSLKDSPYYLRFQDKVSLWETRLADLDEYLQNLNTIQRKWVYLEPIFGRGALPREQARFQRVDQDFRSAGRGCRDRCERDECRFTHLCLCVGRSCQTFRGTAGSRLSRLELESETLSSPYWTSYSAARNPLMNSWR